MIVDSSAIVAMAYGESDAASMAALIRDDPSPRMSAGTLLEISIVVGPQGAPRLDELIEEANIEIVAFDAAQARVARVAYQTFGRGSGSPARLSFGDCFSYALAQTAGEPLLFKGNDFTHTDVTSARS